MNRSHSLSLFTLALCSALRSAAANELDTLTQFFAFVAGWLGEGDLRRGALAISALLTVKRNACAAAAATLTATLTEAAAAALSVCRLIYLPFALEFLFSSALFAQPHYLHPCPLCCHSGSASLSLSRCLQLV